MKNFIVTLFCLALLACCFAQELPVPRNIDSVYNNRTRSKTGMPGKKYWQNTASYDINVNFDPATREIKGSEDIVYENNSPDTLSDFVFKLFPNYYKKGAPRTKEVDPSDLSDGMKVEEILVNGNKLDPSRYFIDYTNMFVKVKLVPSARINFKVVFSYVLNKGSHNRMGQVDEGSYFVAYFFPRITVYDDIDGWNLHPYTGSYEFYNDFCDFKLAVTLPAGYFMWGTGDWVNKNEIITARLIDRIETAEVKDGIVTIIDSTDLSDKKNIFKSNGSNTWRFKAESVPDMVFAVSDHYMWQSTSLVVDSVSGRRTRVDAVFNKVHKDYYKVVADARKTIECMSFRFPKWPFPYPHETVFDGLDQMEYPMMANDNPLEDRAESIELTDHEIFHTLFPFYMGINETKYGWMDEGWATIGEWLISPMIDSSIVDEYAIARYEKAAGKEEDGVVMNLTTQLSGNAFFLNSYPKPAFGYLYVKDMLGDELFYKGLHHYMRTWGGKHPMPLDFFNCMNEGSGVNLNWFWKRWFYETGYPDLAIESVKNKRSSVSITLRSLGNKPVPIDLTFTFNDGTTQKIHRSISVWEKTDKVTLKMNSTSRLRSVKLGSTYTVDSDKSNNYYSR